MERESERAKEKEREREGCLSRIAKKTTTLAAITSAPAPPSVLGVCVVLRVNVYVVLCVIQPWPHILPSTPSRRWRLRGYVRRSRDQATAERRQFPEYRTDSLFALLPRYASVTGGGGIDDHCDAKSKEHWRLTNGILHGDNRDIDMNSHAHTHE